MENKILTSIKNPLIKQVRKLQRPKERQKQNMLLIEGNNLIEAAFQADYKLDIIFYTEFWQLNHPLLCQTIEEKEIRAQLVSQEVLKAIATTINPDGIVAIAPRPSMIKEIPVIQEIGIALERLQDPGNLGTIIRTSAATKADGLWLSPDSVDYYSPKVLRASAGQWFKLPVATNQDLSDLVQQQCQAGVQIIATTAKATQTYWEVDWTRPSLILLGNEGAGLSSELIDLADLEIKIPLANQVESLNVAIASALLLYEAQRQKALSIKH
ncbi:MAG: RNA methyltransferase [Cyanobacteria bacterium P01_C01_bin.72]